MLFVSVSVLFSIVPKRLSEWLFLEQKRWIVFDVILNLEWHEMDKRNRFNAALVSQVCALKSKHLKKKN